MLSTSCRNHAAAAPRKATAICIEVCLIAAWGAETKPARGQRRRRQHQRIADRADHQILIEEGRVEGARPAQACFTFTNAKGDTALVKYKAIPDAGDLDLTDDEAKAKGADFYEAEMKDRLAKGPVSFELVAIRGKDGDQTSDPTLRWDDEDARETTLLGKISIEAMAPDATCNAFSFLPGNVVAGVAGLADDPIFQGRSGAYIVSFGPRRTP